MKRFRLDYLSFQRKSIRKSLGFFCSISLLSGIFSGFILAQSPLIVASWGGAYLQAQQDALFKPFEAETAMQIKIQAYNGGLKILHSESVPDVIDMTEKDARLACEQGLLHKLDLRTRPPILARSQAARKPEDDFIEGAILPCGIAHLTYATLLAFDERAFPGEKPQKITDFFDIKRFPGKRALRKESASALEWALMAEGVPLEQIYDLLSTERGLHLALRRLDKIKDHIVWWDDPEEPSALLEAGEVIMSSGYNGRFFAAQSRGVPLSMIWHGQIIDWNVWVIPRKTKNINKQARRFIHYVTQSDRMAQLAQRIPYGPTRKSALRRIGLHPQSGIPMRDHLPMAAHHLGYALFRDAIWYAHTEKLRKRRFNEWLSQ